MLPDDFVFITCKHENHPGYLHLFVWFKGLEILHEPKLAIGVEVAKYDGSVCEGPGTWHCR